MHEDTERSCLTCKVLGIYSEGRKVTEEVYLKENHIIKRRVGDVLTSKAKPLRSDTLG